MAEDNAVCRQVVSGLCPDGAVGNPGQLGRCRVDSEALLDAGLQVFQSLSQRLIRDVLPTHENLIQLLLELLLDARILGDESHGKYDRVSDGVNAGCDVIRHGGLDILLPQLLVLVQLLQN